MGEFLAFLIDKKYIKNLHKLKSNIVLPFKGKAENIFPAFYKCISDAENNFGEGLNKHASFLFRFELENLAYLSGGSFEKDSVVQFKYSSADLRDKEKTILFYLAGCVFSTFSRKQLCGHYSW